MRMLEPASAPLERPAAQPASAVVARHGGTEQAGFHERLRDALAVPQSGADTFATQIQLDQAKPTPNEPAEAGRGAPAQQGKTSDSDEAVPAFGAADPVGAIPLSGEAFQMIAGAAEIPLPLLQSLPHQPASPQAVEPSPLTLPLADQPLARVAGGIAVNDGAPIVLEAQSGPPDEQQDSGDINAEALPGGALPVSPEHLPNNSRTVAGEQIAPSLEGRQVGALQPSPPLLASPGSGPAKPSDVPASPVMLPQRSASGIMQQDMPGLGLGTSPEAKAAALEPPIFALASPGLDPAEPPQASALAMTPQQPIATGLARVVQARSELLGSPEAAAAQQEAGAAAPIAATPAQLMALQASQVPQPQTSQRAAPPASAEGAALAEHRALPVAQLARALGAMEAAPEVKIVLAAETAEASFRLTSLDAHKPVTAKPQNEGNVEAPAQPALGVALPDGGLQRAEAPVQGAAPREASPPPARQLAPVVVSLALGGGDEALTIALDPGELGRVEVSIGQGKEAGQIRIVAERPETLALLQRDQRELDRALNQAGLGDMARSLSFSLASDQGRQQQQGAPHQGGHRFSGQGQAIEADRPLIPIPNPARSATSLLDIAV
jgi:Meckel syndrome type 1 protein